MRVLPAGLVRKYEADGFPASVRQVRTCGHHARTRLSADTAGERHRHQLHRVLLPAAVRINLPRHYAHMIVCSPGIV